MTRHGIDVSKHQGIIDWAKVKLSKVEFAILRAGYGRNVSQKDVQFERNYAECKRVGMPCGAYWYSYAADAADAVVEAKAFLEVIKGKQFEYPLYFDIEESRVLALGMAKCTEIARAFLDTVEKAGYFVGIYSSKSHLEHYISEDLRKRYAVWVAHYAEKTTYSGKHGMWQYSSTGKILGISGNVDMNHCYEDYPKIIKEAGLNGYEKPSDDVESKDVESDEVVESEVVVNERIHKVKKGDTLWDIAQKYNTTVEKIVADNGIESPDLIYPGQKFKV